MTATTAHVVLRHLRDFAATEQAGALSDRQLLEQFTARREEAAFAALVRRHAPLVLGVCRRVLRQEQDAEDAFQATFLVLARKANEVGRQGSVAGWLHRVAYHAALRARARTANREQHERQAPPRQAADLLAEVTGRELLAVLDEELARLPDDVRDPLVLCYLHGHTCDGAARQLGWSVRTFKRRLEGARRLLRSRLARRGIVLSAALLTLGLTQETRAAVPAALTAAAVAGRGSTAAGVIAEGVLRGLGVARTKWLAALLVLGAIVLGAGGMAYQARPAQGGTAAPAEQPQPAAPPAKETKDDAKKTAVSGRVLDADGKPVKGAVVAGYAGLEFGNLSVQYQAKGFGEVKTDAEGRFRLPTPTAPGEHIRHIDLLAGARRYGPAWSRAVPAGKADVELRLPPEEAVVGRLIDLQGQPLGKAKLRPVRVLGAAAPGGPKVPGPKEDDAKARERRHFLALQRRTQSFEFYKDSPIKDCSLWPQSVTTDAEGRFRVNGFGRGQEVDLVVEDDRVAAQEVSVTAGARESNFSLVPPHKVSGRVVAADTGKPVAGASVLVTSYHDRLGYGTDVRTDADGRYSVNAYPGESYSVAVYPPRGEPYLVALGGVTDWPRGAVKQQVDFKLPRGAVVRGKVVEEGSGKAVVSASVAFLPQRENNPDLPRGIETGEYHRAWTGADGSFEIVFPPGHGHLIVIGPNTDYTYRTISEGELRAGKPGGPAQHYHAVMPLTLRAKDEPKEVKIELRREVTIRGRAVGPDGKPVKDAVVFVPSELLPGRPQGLVLQFGVPPDSHLTAVPVKDGAFELPNCDPEKTYRVFILSGRAEGGMMAGGTMPVVGPSRIDVASVVNKLIMRKDPVGAVADLSAKKAGGKPVEVKLAPCQSAEVRFLDAKGKAVPQKVWLELLVTPGPSATKSRVEGKPAAEGALLATPYTPYGGKSPPAPDAEGRITLPGLIPGATYRLKVLAGLEGMENEIVFEKDFTVEAGKATKLDLKAPEGK